MKMAKEKPNPMYLCVKCVGDSVIKSEIQKEGSLQSCFHCGKQNQSINLEYLSNRVDEVYRKHFYISETPIPDGEENGIINWRYKGKYPKQIISEMMNVEVVIAEKVVEFLHNKYQYEVVHNGAVDYYNNTVTYEKTPVDTYEFSQKWQEFCLRIKHRSRFFDPRNVESLEKIYENIADYKDAAGRSAIRIVDLTHYDFKFLYRAREANDENSRLQICLNPIKELGPPSPEKTRASRMNPAGIPVFYASFDPDTCVAEIRLPVGGIAVVGRFELIRPIRILDLTVFDENPEAISMFESNYEKKAAWMTFLSHFHNEVRKPILPLDEHINYVPTQVIAEYLANTFEPNIDGLIFSSALTEGGKNLVILKHSNLLQKSRKNPQELQPQPKLKGYDWKDYFVISDLKELFEPKDGSEPLIKVDGGLDKKQPLSNKEDKDEPILRFVEGSIELKKVETIKYETKTYKLIKYLKEDADRHLIKQQRKPKL